MLIPIQTALLSAGTAAAITLLIELVAKPRLEARKDRILERHKVLREADRRVFNLTVGDSFRRMLNLRGVDSNERNDELRVKIRSALTSLENVIGHTPYQRWKATTIHLNNAKDAVGSKPIGIPPFEAHPARPHLSSAKAAWGEPAYRWRWPFARKTIKKHFGVPSDYDTMQ